MKMKPFGWSSIFRLFFKFLVVSIIFVAINQKSERVFMLAQSYMPAQDIHIVVNPGSDQRSPWYKVEDIGKDIITSEWIFSSSQLKTW